MVASLEKIKRSKALDIIKKIISSKYLPFATAAVMLACYYLGWDIVAIYYIGIVIILILLLLDDITPLVPQVLFINLVISLKNSPSAAVGGSGYYSSPAILALILVIGALIAAALIYRLVLCCIKKQLKLSPIFYGLCVLCFALLLNGLFSAGYTPKNILYGAVLSVCLLGLYVIVKGNVKINKENFDKIAYGFVALSVLLIVELLVVYATTEGLFASGTINRNKIIFGWGVYNGYGLLIVMCIPAVLYLAGKEKCGYLLTGYSLIVLAASILCCSRQAMIGAVIIYPVSLIILLVKGKYRIPNICIAAAAVAAGIVLICIFREKFIGFFKTVFNNVFVNGELNGSGRWRIWKQALEYFSDAPVFGSGFYVNYNYSSAAGLSFVPLMAHNTVLELMAACGILGLAAYLVHRVQTVISFFKNITIERTFIALTILPILILSLLDNHVFLIFPLLIYASLLAVFDESQKKAEVENIKVK